MIRNEKKQLLQLFILGAGAPHRGLTLFGVKKNNLPFKKIYLNYPRQFLCLSVVGINVSATQGYQDSG